MLRLSRCTCNAVANSRNLLGTRDRKVGDEMFKNHPRIRAVLVKLGELLVKGSVSGFVRWLLERLLGN